MRLTGSEHARNSARKLRRAMTPPEVVLWRGLRRNAAGLRFRRQHPAGDYVLDFYCAPARLVVEVDGEAHSRGDRPEQDARRDAWLMARGLLVLRYPAIDVLADADGVVAHIMAAALGRLDTDRSVGRPPPPSASPPPPPGGGG